MNKPFYILSLALTTVLFWSCREDTEGPQTEPQLPKVGISAPAVFTDGEVSITVTLSEAAVDAITVPLTISDKAAEGFTALSEANLSVDASVIIEKGQKTAASKILLKNAESLDVGKYEAVIAIGNVKGAEINSNASAVHIQFIVEEPQPQTITWTERTDWAMNYDPNVVTGSDSKPFAIVVTACDAPYFLFTAAPAGTIASMGIEAVATNVAEPYLQYVESGQATPEQLAAAKYVYTPAMLPLVAPSNVERTPVGCELILIGFDSDFKLSGEWHMEINTYEEKAPGINWTERTDWAMNYDPIVVTGSDSKPFAIVVTACDAPYFLFTAAPAGTIASMGIEAVATNVAEPYLQYVESGQATPEQLAAAKYVYTPAMLPLVAPSNEERTPEGCELILIGFDSDFKLSGEWHMEVNTYKAGWTNRTDWSINYDSTVDTGMADKPIAIVIDKCDADYFMFNAYAAGTVAKYGIDVIAEQLTSPYRPYVESGQVTFDQLLAMKKYVFAAGEIPMTIPTSLEKVPAGCEFVIIGVDEGLNPTKEWHIELNNYPQ